MSPGAGLFLRSFTGSILGRVRHITMRFVTFGSNGAFTVGPTIDIRLHVSAIGFCGLRAFHRSSFFRRPTLICSVMAGSIPIGRICISTRSVRITLLRGGRIRGPESRPVIGHDDSGNVVRVSLRVGRLLSSTRNVDGDRVLGCRLSGFHRMVRGCGNGHRRGVIFVRNGNSKILQGTLLSRLGHGCDAYHCRSTSFRRCNFKTALIAVQ